MPGHGSGDGPLVLRARLDETAPDSARGWAWRLFGADGHVAGDPGAGPDAGLDHLARLLGELVPPVTVEVRVPPVAADLLALPLEEIPAGGATLAKEGVTFVRIIEPGDEAGGDSWAASGSGRTRARVRRPGDSTGPVTAPVRILAVFGQPDWDDGTSQRTARDALRALVNDLVARSNRALELRVLHYGAQTSWIRAAVEDQDGWDIVHVAGRFAAAGAGEADGDAFVPGVDLVPLLRPFRRRLKLLVLAPSGPVTAASAVDGWALPASLPAGIAVALRVADRLGCAVLAPLGDDVDGEAAAAFTTNFYERLLGRGQALTAAVRGATEAADLAAPDIAGSGARAGAAGRRGGAAFALFGESSSTLAFRLPEDPGPATGPASVRMEGFPAWAGDRPAGPVPAGVLNRAARLLAPARLVGGARPNGVPPVGLVLVGPPGADPAGWAVELAREAEGWFRAFCWYSAADSASSRHGQPAALSELRVGLAQALDTQAEPFQLGLYEAARGHQAVARQGPRFTAILGRSAILLVVTLDELLTQNATFRDGFLRDVLHAAVGHRGPSRLVLCGERVPADLLPDIVDGRVVVEHLDAPAPDGPVPGTSPAGAGMPAPGTPAPPDSGRPPGASGPPGRWPSAPASGRRPPPLPLPLPRTVVQVDVVGYSERDDQAQLDLVRALEEVVDDAIGRAGIEPDEFPRQSRGDGFLGAVSPMVPAALVASRFVRELWIGLRRHNATRNAQGRIRLRLALHRGDVILDRAVWAGSAVVVATRLVDASPVRQALHDDPAADLALIVSETFFETVIRQKYLDLDPDAFRQVVVANPKYDGTAWLSMPGSPPALPARPPGPTAPGPGGLDAEATDPTDPTEQVLSVAPATPGTVAPAPRPAALVSEPEMKSEGAGVTDASARQAPPAAGAEDGPEISLTPDEERVLIEALAANYGSELAAAPLLYGRLGLRRGTLNPFGGERPNLVWWAIYTDLRAGRIAKPGRRLVVEVLRDYPHLESLRAVARRHGLVEG